MVFHPCPHLDPVGTLQEKSTLDSRSHCRLQSIRRGELQCTTPTILPSESDLKVIPTRSAIRFGCALDAFLENDVKLGIDLPTTSCVNTSSAARLCNTNKIVMRRRRSRTGRPAVLFMQVRQTNSVVNRAMISQIARNVVRDIVYDQDGFSYTRRSRVLLHGHSPDIAMGVEQEEKGRGAGGDGRSGPDVGFACKYESEVTRRVFMPAPIYVEHKIIRCWREKRRSKQLFDRQPEAKSQVTVTLHCRQAVGMNQGRAWSTPAHAEPVSNRKKSYSPAR